MKFSTRGASKDTKYPADTIAKSSKRSECDRYFRPLLDSSQVPRGLCDLNEDRLVE